MIVLITDFGLSDPYVGIMKGVIKKISPSSEILDLSHRVPPGNIALARLFLEQSYPFFPAKTVFVAVVDPGVGTSRKPLAIRAGDYYFVGPDNGLFSFVETVPATPKQVVALDRPEFHLKSPPGGTFHGRDVFAPAAAYLDRGIPVFRLGSFQDGIVTLPGVSVRRTDWGLEVPLVHVDHFGNLIFALTRETLERTVGLSSFSLEIAGRSVERIADHYDTREPLVALFNSFGLLEIAVPGGNAASQLGISSLNGAKDFPLRIRIRE